MRFYFPSLSKRLPTIARKIQTREPPSTFRHNPSTPPTEYRPVTLIFATLSADSSLDFFDILLFTTQPTPHKVLELAGLVKTVLD